MLFGRYADNGSPLPQRTLFYDDLDKRAGYYVGTSANYRGLVELRALHYDNRANLAAESVAIDDSAWLTYFDSLGARWTPTDAWTVISQWLHGRTYEDAEAPTNAWSFDAEFLLASWTRGAMRYSARYDRFEMQQTVSSFEYLPFLLADHGHVWTLACMREFGPRWTVTLEGIIVSSSVPLRVALGAPEYARENMLQLALRYER